ncbi:MAG: hypothetical protein IAF38_16065 [Bacteroidia bacterium]|nr:hypothetical protein [Bacteroidia bacterium]
MTSSHHSTIPPFHQSGKPLRFVLFFLVFLSSGKFFAQNYDSLFSAREKIILEGVDYRNAMIRWNFTNLGDTKLDVSYERKMNLNLSWVGGVVWDFSKEKGGIYPNAAIRYYYNLEERIINRWTKKNKKTSAFSADYFEGDLRAGYNYGYKEQPDNSYPHGIVIGPALKIGTQRNIGKHFYYDAFLGYRIIINYKGLPIAGISVGLVL